jgi:MYXO-CTERM domain-containing protein
MAGPIQCPVESPDSVAVDSACPGLGASIFGYSGSSWIAKGEDMWRLGDADYNDAEVAIHFGEFARITIVQNGFAVYDNMIGAAGKASLHGHAYGSYADFEYTPDAEFILELRNPFGHVFESGGFGRNTDNARHWFVQCVTGCQPDPPPPPPVPEPSTFALAGLGAAALLAVRAGARRRAKLQQ